MKRKKFIALFMSLTFLFLAGCSARTAETSSYTSSKIDSSIAGNNVINILYSSKDTLDPYTCVTQQNDMLCQLIFEPLLVLDNDYNIEYRLAQSVTVEKNICNITIKNAKFSDGSTVTAEDVVFSFNKAKTSTTTSHAAALKYTTSVTASDSKNITVTLSREDPYFANLLTFPIMKKDSDTLKDVDNRSLPPIGAGKYIFSLATETLTVNSNYYGIKPVFDQIKTVDCPDNEAVDQAVKAGMVDLYYSNLTDNDIPKMNGKTADINQNMIVFMGVSPKSSALKNTYLKQAISSAIDREDICNSAYYSKADAALGPFPDFWEPATGYMSIQPNANKEIAKNNLSIAGYSLKEDENFYKNSNGDTLTLSLLVNKENTSRTLAAESIAEHLKKVGIKINILAYSEEEYTACLKRGNYDLYLGEIRIENNMDLGGLCNTNSASVLLPGANSDSATSSDVSSRSERTEEVTEPTADEEVTSLSNENDLADGTEVGDITLTSLEAYDGFYKGIYSLQDLITAFTAELPVIPVCFKKGLVIYSDSFKADLSPSVTSLFNGIEFSK